MLHPILFVLYLVYGGTPNNYEIAPRPDSGYDVTVIDPWSGARLGDFYATSYERVDGRYTFLAFGDPTWGDEWQRYLKGHNGVFPTCSQGGTNLLWIEGENLHILRLLLPGEY
jgi:hypothetical protein